VSRRLKKRPYWLYAVLASVLLLLVTVLLLPDEQTVPEYEPVVAEVDTDQHSRPEPDGSGDVAFEELTEEKQLQAPKKVEVTIHNGFPESGIALVIDDVGYDMKALARLLALPFPVAISILPDSPRATEAAALAHEAGKVVMLHLPMEPTTPKYRAKMGASFLRADMNELQIRERFQTALEQVPHAEGVNNHMGSLLTTHTEPMQWVMQVCRERSLFFVDSKTAHDSVAAELAAQEGVVWGARSIFLDHTVDAEDLRMAWDAALRCAHQKGSCIVIAHPHAETLDFLEQQVKMKDHGLIRPVTSMLHRERAS